jgi:hypothetical protein
LIACPVKRYDKTSAIRSDLINENFIVGISFI